MSCVAGKSLVPKDHSVLLTGCSFLLLAFWFFFFLRYSSLSSSFFFFCWCCLHDFDLPTVPVRANEFDWRFTNRVYHYAGKSLLLVR